MYNCWWVTKSIDTPLVFPKQKEMEEKNLCLKFPISKWISLQWARTVMWKCGNLNLNPQKPHKIRAWSWTALTPVLVKQKDLTKHSVHTDELQVQCFPVSKKWCKEHRAGNPLTSSCLLMGTDRDYTCKNATPTYKHNSPTQ